MPKWFCEIGKIFRCSKLWNEYCNLHWGRWRKVKYLITVLYTWQDILYIIYSISYTVYIHSIRCAVTYFHFGKRVFDREKGTPPDFVNFIQVKNPFLLFKRILYLIISGKSFLNFKPRNHIFNKMKFGKNYQTKAKLEKYFLYCWVKDRFTQWTIGWIVCIHFWKKLAKNIPFINEFEYLNVCI